MIVKFFVHGASGGREPVRYLTEQDGEPREDAVVLRGNSYMIEQQIDSIQNRQKYTSGVLSFAEKITPEQKEEIIDGFEFTLFPGMSKSRYSSLWVEHKEHNRTELHFVFPRKDLVTNKGLQPYFTGADKKRVNAWKDIINIEHNLADPNDPIRQRGLVFSRNLPKDKKIIIKKIHDGVKALIASGEVIDRKSLVDKLSENGFDVVRQVKSSISIKDPSGEKKNIRLKGMFYERDFTASRINETKIGGATREYDASRTKRLGEARKIYRCGIEIRRKEIKKRHGEAVSKDAAIHKETSRDMHSADPDFERNSTDNKLVSRKSSDGESPEVVLKSGGVGKQSDSTRNRYSQGQAVHRVGSRSVSVGTAVEWHSSASKRLSYGRDNNKIIECIETIAERSRKTTADIQNDCQAVIEKSKRISETIRQAYQIARSTLEHFKLAIKKMVPQSPLDISKREL